MLRVEDFLLSGGRIVVNWIEAGRKLNSNLFLYRLFMV
jgi:hypothetical protein